MPEPGFRPCCRPVAIFMLAGLMLSAVLAGCTADPVETDLLLPVDFSNVPDNMVLTRFHTDKIEIKVRAAPELIDAIQVQNTRYLVDIFTDLSFDPAGDTVSIEPGEYLFPVEKERIALGPGVTVMSINPSHLSATLERKIRKTFKIQVPYVGKAARGHRAMEAVTRPASVTLSGPVSVIGSIKTLRTKPVDLADAHEGFMKKVPLDIDMPSVVPSHEPVVTVSITIKEILVSRTIRDLPIRINRPDAGVTVEPPVLTVTVKGPFETLGRRNILKQIHSFMDLENLEPGVYARHAVIDIPVGLIMTDAVPQVFTVKIE